MRAWAVKNSDIDRCPHRILSPEHYRADGSCKCYPVRKVEEAPDIADFDAQ